jgi:hypothetical protein
MVVHQEGVNRHKTFANLLIWCALTLLILAKFRLSFGALIAVLPTGITGVEYIYRLDN